MANERRFLAGWLQRDEANRDPNGDEDEFRPPWEDDAGPVNLTKPFVREQTEKLLTAWRDDDLHDLLAVIREAEMHNCPKPDRSRLLGDSSWEKVAIWLLCQCDKDVITSFMDGTITRRARGDLRDEVREAGPRWEWLDRDDPAIYANCLAGDDGFGLTCDEMNLFLDAMLVGVGLQQDPNNTTHRDGRSVSVGVGAIYAKLGRDVAFWDEKRTKTWSKNIETFVTINRAIVEDARTKGCNHIMFRPEVGWSYRASLRCDEHAKLIYNKSPDIFRYAQLVLQHLFPKRSFRLHSFIIFEVLDEFQAGIGEALASQILSSYDCTGGFNFEQAGIPVDIAWKFDASDWARVQRVAVELGYTKRLEANFERFDNAGKSRVAKYETMKRNKKAFEELELARSRRDEAFRKLDNAIAASRERMAIEKARLEAIDITRARMNREAEELAAAIEARKELKTSLAKFHT